MQGSIRMGMLAAALVMAVVPSAMAGSTGGGMHGQGMSMQSGAWMEQATVDGYTVRFHVMRAVQDNPMGGPYHLMVKVEKGQAPVKLLAVNSKVVHPNGASESKMMMKMGPWWMAAYDLAHPGEHRLMVLFKTKDGTKHFVGVSYENPASQG